MTINLETMPSLFFEVGEKAADPIIKALAARCALFAGVVQRMAEHIAKLEEQLLAFASAAPSAPPAPVEKPTETEEEPAEPLNADAQADLDAEALALAEKRNGGPVIVQQPAIQIGTAKGEQIQ